MRFSALLAARAADPPMSIPVTRMPPVMMKKYLFGDFTTDARDVDVSSTFLLSVLP